MSEHESIKKTVDQLNHNKSNIVKAVKKFVDISKDLGQKTKDKKGAEQILVTAQQSEKYAAANIPDLVLTHGPTPAGEVKIKHPADGSHHLHDTDIKLEFETKHVHVPFTYAIIGQEKVSMTQFLIKAAVSHHDKVLIHSIKEDDKKKLSVGTYDIIVHIIDPATNKDIVPPDKITIQVTPRGITPGTNTVKLLSPSASLSPYNTNTIPLQFKVEGPHHDSIKEYAYQLVYKNITTNTSAPIIAGRARDKEVKAVVNLPNGTYEAHLKIFNPGASMSELSHSDPVTFVVDNKGGPTPGPVGPTPGIKIINDIIINNNTNIYNINVYPFSLPITIEILPNRAHINEVISKPINIWITSSIQTGDKYTTDKTLRDILNADLKQTLTQELIFEKSGRYRLDIVLHRDRQPLFRKIVYIEIRDDKTVKKEAKLASIINEIRSDIKNGLATSINSIKIKLDETSKNDSLRPYLNEMRSLFIYNDYNILKSEAEKLMSKEGTTPQVGGVCGAIINRINEYQYYFKLVDIFKKNKEIESIADYLYILQKFDSQKSVFKNITATMNKSQQDDMKRRKPQDDALKVISKIETATILVENNT